MKVVILAGGLGTRILEETVTKPKAMVQISDQPIIWHIMQYFSFFGFNEFIIALGYKGDCITNWIQNKSGSTIPSLSHNKEVKFLDFNVRDVYTKSDWKIQLVDTGQKTLTGGRIKRLAPLLDDQPFFLTFCDILADVNLHALLDFHRSHGKISTLTAVRPQSRYGHLVLDGNKIMCFNEKPLLDWVNGGFFVFEPEVVDYIKDNENSRLEKEVLENLAKDGELMAFRHHGFWQCMDTFPEKILLEQLLLNDQAPWKKW